MLPLRFARHWQGISVLMLLCILAGAVIPAAWFLPDNVEFVSWLGSPDKWAHGILFAFLTVWFAGQYARQSYWRIVLALAAFGILLELSQGLVTYRSSEWLDLGANVVGIVVGLVIAVAGAGGWCMPFEAWYIGRKEEGRID